MKKRGFLSILIIITLVIMTGLNEMSRSDINTDFNGYYADVDFDMTENNDEKIITYVNKEPYAVELTNNNIYITCTGTGENKEADEALVEKNMRIIARFRKGNSKELSNSIVANKNETVYIHLSSVFEGVSPQNEVNCDYQISITAS